MLIVVQNQVLILVIININGIRNDNTLVVIYNINGEIIKQIRGNNIAEINLGVLSSGIYLLTITNQKITKTYKLIKK